MNSMVELSALGAEFSFLGKIKTKLGPEQYQNFIKSLLLFQKQESGITIQQVQDQVGEIFIGHEDLYNEFIQLLHPKIHDITAVQQSDTINNSDSSPDNEKKSNQTELPINSNEKNEQHDSNINPYIPVIVYNSKCGELPTTLNNDSIIQNVDDIVPEEQTCVINTKEPVLINNAQEITPQSDLLDIGPVTPDVPNDTSLEISDIKPVESEHSELDKVTNVTQKIGLCRTCGCKAQPGVSLLLPEHHRLCKWITNNMKLKFCSDNGLPYKLCLPCIEQIQLWIQFNSKCKKIQSVFTHSKPTSTFGLTQIKPAVQILCSNDSDEKVPLNVKKSVDLNVKNSSQLNPCVQLDVAQNSSTILNPVPNVDIDPSRPILNDNVEKKENSQNCLLESSTVQINLQKGPNVSNLSPIVTVKNVNHNLNHIANNQLQEGKTDHCKSQLEDSVQCHKKDSLNSNIVPVQNVSKNTKKSDTKNTNKIPSIKYNQKTNQKIKINSTFCNTSVVPAKICKTVMIDKKIENVSKDNKRSNKRNILNSIPRKSSRQIKMNPKFINFIQLKTTTRKRKLTDPNTEQIPETSSETPKVDKKPKVIGISPEYLKEIPMPELTPEVGEQEMTPINIAEHPPTLVIEETPENVARIVPKKSTEATMKNQNIININTLLNTIGNQPGQYKLTFHKPVIEKHEENTETSNEEISVKIKKEKKSTGVVKERLGRPCSSVVASLKSNLGRVVKRRYKRRVLKFDSKLVDAAAEFSLRRSVRTQNKTISSDNDGSTTDSATESNETNESPQQQEQSSNISIQTFKRKPGRPKVEKQTLSAVKESLYNQEVTKKQAVEKGSEQSKLTEKHDNKSENLKKMQKESGMKIGAQVFRCCLGSCMEKTIESIFNETSQNQNNLIEGLAGKLTSHNATEEINNCDSNIQTAHPNILQALDLTVKPKISNHTDCKLTTENNKVERSVDLNKSCSTFSKVMKTNSRQSEQKMNEEKSSRILPPNNNKSSSQNTLSDTYNLNCLADAAESGFNTNREKFQSCTVTSQNEKNLEKICNSDEETVQNKFDSVEKNVSHLNSELHNPSVSDLTLPTLSSNLNQNNNSQSTTTSKLLVLPSPNNNKKSEFPESKSSTVSSPLQSVANFEIKSTLKLVSPRKLKQNANCKLQLTHNKKERDLQSPVGKFSLNSPTFKNSNPQVLNNITKSNIVSNNMLNLNSKAKPSNITVTKCIVISLQSPNLTPHIQNMVTSSLCLPEDSHEQVVQEDSHEEKVQEEEETQNEISQPVLCDDTQNDHDSDSDLIPPQNMVHFDHQYSLLPR